RRYASDVPVRSASSTTASGPAPASARYSPSASPISTRAPPPIAPQSATALPSSAISLLSSIAFCATTMARLRPNAWPAGQRNRCDLDFGCCRQLRRAQRGCLRGGHGAPVARAPTSGETRYGAADRGSTERRRGLRRIERRFLRDQCVSPCSAAQAAICAREVKLSLAR